LSLKLRGVPAPALDKRERDAPTPRLLKVALRLLLKPPQLIAAHDRQQHLSKGGGELER
jgi:hypothetical protein